MVYLDLVDAWASRVFDISSISSAVDRFRPENFRVSSRFVPQSCNIDLGQSERAIIFDVRGLIDYLSCVVGDQQNAGIGERNLGSWSTNRVLVSRAYIFCTKIARMLQIAVTSVTVYLEIIVGSAWYVLQICGYCQFCAKEKCNQLV